MRLVHRHRHMAGIGCVLHNLIAAQILPVL